VLDGVVDCPDRIVIMTTNHPEKLDPALIRPGRINLKIYLGFVECQEAMNMCEHYFGGYKGNYFTPHQKKEFEKTWEVLRVPSGGRLNLTPAQLEQLCAENDSLDDLCAAIHKIADTVNFRESAALSRKESKSGKTPGLSRANSKSGKPASLSRANSRSGKPASLRRSNSK